jgi:energy-coupling factor transporter ATP-binding protein EcfA2
MPNETSTSPRIERITLEGVGPFDGATFDPLPPTGAGELVLFEGPNGSGKTTVLEAIAVLIGAAGRSLGLAAHWKPRSPSPEDVRKILRMQLDRAAVRGEVPEVVPTVPPVTSLLRRIRTEEPRIDLSLEKIGRLSLLAEPKRVALEGPSELFQQVTEMNAAAAEGTPTSWAAFAFRGAQPTADLATEGPKRIDRPVLRGALSFADVFPASAELGQILVNIYFDRLQAWSAAEQARGTPAEAGLRAQADAQQASLDRMARALSGILGRKVTIEFLPRQRPPVIRLDGEVIPLDLLGEGFRRTLAWLSDLCARLELTSWNDPTRSPFDQDFWLLLDEIDQSLHPALQRRILPALRRLFPNARIYATTHSPFVVASAPDGCVFPIRPDPATHRVSGPVLPIKLGPGHSLSWAVEEVFDVPSSFVDEETIARLAEHKRAVERIRRGDLEGFDWAAFAQLRAPFVEGEGEGRAIVTLTEAKVRALIDEKLRELAKGSREGA